LSRVRTGTDVVCTKHEEHTSTYFMEKGSMSALVTMLVKEAVTVLSNGPMVSHSPV
jgi:hypothetical protein